MVALANVWSFHRERQRISSRHTLAKAGIASFHAA
jgi:hypothetical protein